MPTLGLTTASRRLGDFAWWGLHEENSAPNEAHAHLVAQRKPNKWGLCDVHGNVSEWCGDAYQQALPGGRNPRVESDAPYRVIRGGACTSPSMPAFGKTFSPNVRLYSRSCSVSIRPEAHDENEVSSGPCCLRGAVCRPPRRLRRHRRPPLRQTARPTIYSWPEGFAAIIADESYLDGYNYQNPGYVIENVDTFYYGGDTEALNLFLEKLAKVKGMRVTVGFSGSVGRVNRHVRAGTVRQQKALGLPLSEIDGKPCSWLVTVTPSQSKDSQAETQILVFLGGERIDVEKLRLPAWGN